MSRSATQSPAASLPKTSMAAQAEVLDHKAFSQFIEMVGWEEAVLIGGDFEKDAEQLAAQIREALPRKDTAKLALAAHTLKGVSQLFGATQVAVAAESLYRMARAGDLTGAEPILAELDAALPLAEEALARELDHKDGV